MQESADRESSRNERDSEQESAADSEATSKETLSDLEEKEADGGSNSSNSDAGPSPDGAFDESDEIKDAGPM